MRVLARLRALRKAPATRQAPAPTPPLTAAPELPPLQFKATRTGMQCISPADLIEAHLAAGWGL
jgi:hypothetical protein